MAAASAASAVSSLSFETLAFFLGGTGTTEAAAAVADLLVLTAVGFFVEDAVLAASAVSSLSFETLVFFLGGTGTTEAAVSSLSFETLVFFVGGTGTTEAAAAAAAAVDLLVLTTSVVEDAVLPASVDFADTVAVTALVGFAAVAASVGFSDKVAVAAVDVSPVDFFFVVAVVSSSYSDPLESNMCASA